MSERRKLSEREKEELLANIAKAEDKLDELFSYERVGIDVTRQREALNAAIKQSKDILNEFS